MVVTGKAGAAFLHYGGRMLRNFWDLPAHRRWAYAAHASYIFGSLAWSIAVLLRMIEAGAVGDQQAFSVGPGPGRNQTTQPGPTPGYWEL